MSNASQVTEPHVSSLPTKTTDADPLAFLYSEQASYCVTPDASSALFLMKQAALHGGGMGCKIVSFDSLLDEFWLLYGDDRMRVTPFLRSLFMLEAIGDVPDASLTPSDEPLLSSIASSALHAVTDASQDDLASGEIDLICVLRHYRDRLDAAGYCENDDILDALLASSFVEGISFSFRGFTSRSPLQYRAIAALDPSALAAFDPIMEPAPNEELDGALSYLAGNDVALRADGSLRFAFSSGPSSTDRAIVDTVLRLCDEGACTGYVASPDPLRLYEDVAEELTAASIVATLNASIPFASTPVGMAILGMYSYLESPEEEPDPFPLVDALYSAVFAIDPTRVADLDRRWRGRRIPLRQRCLDELLSVQPDMKVFFDAHEDGGLRALSTAVIDSLSSSAKPVGDYAALETLAALEFLQEVLSAFDDGYVSPETLHLFISQATVPLRVQTSCSDPRASVLFCDVAHLASCFGSVSDFVVLADQSSEAFPYSSRPSVAYTLYSRLGIDFTDADLYEKRLTFMRSLVRATSTIVIHRPLFTAKADESYPSSLLEELVDAYRVDTSDPDDLDHRTALPPCFDPFVTITSDSDLCENRFAVYSSVSASGADAVPSDYFTPGKSAQDPVRHFSASQIESYLSCPARWFASSRVGASDLDAGFSVSEKGDFAHRVLAASFEEFGALGLSPSDEKDQDRCRAILDGKFDDILSQSIEYDRTGNPPRVDSLVPLDSLDRLETERIRVDLHEFIRAQTGFLPGYTPRYFEWRFGGKTPYDYAGFPLVGTVDRIDVDADGHAVIIDYKYGLGAKNSYSIKLPGDLDEVCDGSPEHPYPLPAKIQGLIYAKAVKELLGLTPVAVVYLGYRPKNGAVSIEGAYDSTMIGPSDLAWINSATCSTQEARKSTLDELMEHVEVGVESALKRLVSGDFAVRPSASTACRFCPCIACESRG